MASSSVSAKSSSTTTRKKNQNNTPIKNRSVIFHGDDEDKMNEKNTATKRRSKKNSSKASSRSKTTTTQSPSNSSIGSSSVMPAKSRHIEKSDYGHEDTSTTDIVVKSTQLQNRHYTVKPIIPARKKELISVARAMHREKFAPRVKKLFERETKAAIGAVESGFYIGWRCPSFTWDCIRLDHSSRCFCDHSLQEHDMSRFEAGQPNNGRSIKCSIANCSCRSFNFVPQRPEDIGEWWLRKRPDFDESAWRAKCRCKHSHVHHNPVSRRCKVACCACFRFESNFLCAACDRHLEEHETFFEDAKMRQQSGLPCGQHYLPFNELPDLRNICLSENEDDSRRYEEIAYGPYSIPPGGSMNVTPDRGSEERTLSRYRSNYNH